MLSSRVPASEVKMENTTTKPNWLELPRDVTLNILQRLGTVEIITSACLVCPLWWNFCKDPYIWRTIHMPEFYHRRYNRVDWVKMCRYAVDRSCGQLEDIYIYMFGNDELLEYIADRASNLRRIGLVYCDKLSDKVFIEAVKKLPLIEELDISENSHLSKHSFEAVGSCCPLLKTLSYGRNVSIDLNDEAFVIAKTMPGLRNLTISGYRLTSVGVVAILDGCSLLESLNLECCSSMSSITSLSENLRKSIVGEVGIEETKKTLIGLIELAEHYAYGLWAQVEVRYYRWIMIIYAAVMVTGCLLKN
ncbi:putative F-box/LRR-repeat protein 9 [Vicia villosa]|uniref:putative F-box/LRR-repeat protein 9 n=1 Tax=Vicia villosa TaxID=3911 RepID=UPI00273C9267|nr:putative F-box/LRR-repeat protein 9 [Vicia villosa]